MDHDLLRILKQAQAKACLIVLPAYIIRKQVESCIHVRSLDVSTIMDKG